MDPEGDGPEDMEAAAAASTLMGLKLLNPEKVLSEIQSDEDAMAAYNDALAAVEEASGGKRRKRRGGADKRKGGPGESGDVPEKKLATETGAVPTQVQSTAPAAPGPSPWGPVEQGRKIVKAVRSVAQPAAAVVGVATVLNRPTVYGNIARLVAEVVKTGLNTTVTSTWGDWGRAILDIANSASEVGSTLLQQSIQGPVVPMTIATAIMYRRAQAAGISIGELVRRDAAAIQEGAAKVPALVTQFRDAAKKEASAQNIADLKQIAQRIKAEVEKTKEETRSAEAARAADAMKDIRPAGDPIRVLAEASTEDIKAQREAISAALALASLSEPAPMNTEGTGGRRRRRRTKRKAPKRRRATRKLLTFVY